MELFLLSVSYSNLCLSIYIRWFLRRGVYFFSFHFHTYCTFENPIFILVLESTADGLAVTASRRLSLSLVILTVTCSTTTEHRDVEFLISVYKMMSLDSSSTPSWEGWETDFCLDSTLWPAGCRDSRRHSIAGSLRHTSHHDKAPVSMRVDSLM